MTGGGQESGKIGGEGDTGDSGEISNATLLNFLIWTPFFQDYRMTMYFRQTWGDPRLQFNGTDPIVAQGNILDKIWIPDTYFTSEKKSNFHEVTKKNYVLVFFPNGTVFFSIRYAALTTLV